MMGLEVLGGGAAPAAGWPLLAARTPLGEQAWAALRGLGLRPGDLLVLALLAALAWALLARRRPRRREGPPGPTLAGALVGALCGVATYALGYVAIALSAPLPRFQGMGAMAALGQAVGTVTWWELAMAGAGAAFGAAFARYRWRSLGLLSYVGLVILVAGYAVYAFTAALPQVPPEHRWVSLALLLAEGGSLGLVLIFAFYGLDVSSRQAWARTPGNVPYAARYLPKVALHVPVYNEPMEVVKVTVARLAAQDYPRDRFTVMVLDDSTDEAARAELRAFCQEVGAQHVTRADRRGFKAGALNHALRLTPRDVEVIGVVDADYWVAPAYLKETVGYFIDPRLGFLQTPQDYRNVDESFLTRQYFRAEAYFYHAVLPSRNEENAIIFCGTMGLIRRGALEHVGGWAEHHVCEDAELSVRLSAQGWDSMYVDRSFGQGLMPAVFDAYKKQFHRWAFGNVRILTSHFANIVGSPMSARQKFDFVAGNLHWFDGVFITAIALSLLAVSLGDAAGSKVVTHHQRELALLALVPLFILVDGVARLHLTLRRTGPVRVKDTLLVMGMWFAIKFTNMAAALKALSGVRMPFVRTPKGDTRKLGRAASAARAVRLARGEALMALVLFAASALTLLRAAGSRAEEPLGLVLLGLWLAFYALIYACAPIYAYLSYRTLRPMPPPRPERSTTLATRRRPLLRAKAR